MCVLTPSSSAHRFWGTNRQTSSHLVLMPKLRNHRGDFVSNHQTAAIDFDVQIRKPERVVLRLNHKNRSHWFWGQTGRNHRPCFEAKLRNPRSLPPSAWCRPHTTSSDLLIVRPLSTWPTLDHPQFSAPSLLFLPWSMSLPAMPHLSPTHYETSKHVSPHEIDSRVEPPKFHGFKFNLRRVNYSSQIKPIYWPLGFSCTLPHGTVLLNSRHVLFIHRCHIVINPLLEITSRWF
jgi:hypothetical protein